LWSLLVKHSVNAPWTVVKETLSEPAARSRYMHTYLDRSVKGPIQLWGPSGLILEAPPWEQRKAGRKQACQPGGAAMLSAGTVDG
jgi:hypothetical protein